MCEAREAASFTESVVEEAALDWLESMVWRVAHVLKIAPVISGELRFQMAERLIGGNRLMVEPSSGRVVVYEAPDGDVRVDVRLDQETVWLSPNQRAEQFGRDKSVYSRHLRNVFTTGDMERAAAVAKSATVQREGSREMTRNFDTIISVGT